MAYWLLFLQSFLAATLIPFSSEAVLSGMLLGGYDATLCLIFATLGNWLGGMSSYGLGFLGKLAWIEKYLRIKPEKVNRWKASIQKYGSYVAFWCWLPFVGDVLAVALGFFKVNVGGVAVFMLIGKFLRYLAIVYFLS